MRAPSWQAKPEAVAFRPDDVTSPSLAVATPRARLSLAMQSPWVFGPVAGAVLGLPILGIGSRIAMRLVAVGTNRAGAFTVEGSLTVIFFGVVAGIAGGAIYAILARFLQPHTVARSISFGVIIVLLTLRGVAPVTAFTLSLFLPLTLAYAVLLDVIWRRSPVAHTAATSQVTREGHRASDTHGGS